MYVLYILYIPIILWLLSSHHHHHHLRALSTRARCMHVYVYVYVYTSARREGCRSCEIRYASSIVRREEWNMPRQESGPTLDSRHLISSHDRDHAGEDARAKDLEPLGWSCCGGGRRSDEDFQPGGDSIIYSTKSTGCTIYAISPVVCCPSI